MDADVAPTSGSRAAAKTEIRADELVDLTTGGAALEAIDDCSPLQHEQHRRLSHPEMVRKLWAAIGIELDHTKALLLRDLHPRDQALHSSRGAAVPSTHEHECWSAAQTGGTSMVVRPLHIHVMEMPRTRHLETGAFGRGREWECNVFDSNPRGGFACRARP